MKTLQNIGNSYQLPHYGVLRVVLAAAPFVSMLLALGTGGHLLGGHLAGIHWIAGSHWN